MQDDDVNHQFNLLEIAIYSTSKPAWEFLRTRNFAKDEPRAIKVPAGILFEATQDDEKKVRELARFVQIVSEAPNEFRILNRNPLAKCSALLELVDVPQHTT